MEKQNNNNYRKWQNIRRDKDDRSFLGLYNERIGKPVLAAFGGIGALIQIVSIIKELKASF
jgi:hypothetical protein